MCICFLSSGICRIKSTLIYLQAMNKKNYIPINAYNYNQNKNKMNNNDDQLPLTNLSISTTSTANTTVVVVAPLVD